MKRVIKPLILMCMLSILFLSCEDIFKDKHQLGFEDPPWLGGTIIETLRDSGEFSIFLELMELAGYTDPIEKGLWTVFAADDNAYRNYLQGIGKTSITELNEFEARQLFALNVMNTPRSEFELIYEKNWGKVGPDSELGALMFRKPTVKKTYSKDTSIYFESSVVKVGDAIKLRGLSSGSRIGANNYIPLFSTQFFNEYAGATDGSDYTFFFPQTPWSGLQWYNANINEAEVRCSNGYIYYLDRVVPEVPSIDEYLRLNKDKYGLFYKMAQRFVSYQGRAYSQDIQDFTFQKVYEEISDLAFEGGPSADGEYEYRNTYTAFIPTNEALQEYLNNTFLKLYPSIDSIPRRWVYFLLQSHIIGNFALPSKIEKFGLRNGFGDKTDFSLQNNTIEASVFSNGAFFGINTIFEPQLFKAIPGPLFYNKEYSTFLMALSLTEYIVNLSREEFKATLFAAPNDELEEYGIRYEPVLNRMESKNRDNVWARMSDADIVNFITDHIVFHEYNNFNGEGFIRMESGNYIFYDNSEIIGGGNAENNDKAAIVDSKPSGINGTLFYLNKPIIRPALNIAKHIAASPEYSELFELLVQAELVDSILDNNTNERNPTLPFLSGYLDVTAFLPDNDAINAAKSIGRIPDEKGKLQDFLKYHFITDQIIFDDGKLSGNFATAKIDTIIEKMQIFSKLSISNVKNNLRITDSSGQVVDVPHNSANKMVLKGVVHRIGSVLKYE